MQQIDQRLREGDVRVAVVTFETADVAARFQAEVGVTWPILLDPDRVTYRAYGLGRAKLRHLLGPTTIAAYAREAARGVFPGMPTGDTTQQGGDVLIDPDGIVRFHHIGAGSGYRRPVHEILAATDAERS